MKNRLGAYHEPRHTIIDPTFLSTLPEAEIRNGIAEILKISSCTHIATFEALEQHGHTFIETHFGHSKVIDLELVEVAETVIRQSKRPSKHFLGTARNAYIDSRVQQFNPSSKSRFQTPGSNASTV